MNMNIYDIILVIMITIIVLFIEYIVYRLKSKKIGIDQINHLKDKKESYSVPIETMRFLVEPGTVDHINKLIDGCIADAANIYTVLELVKNENNFLTPDDKKRMSDYLYAMTMKQMTDEMLETIKLVHIIETSDDLSNLIRLHVNIFMINFSSQYNSLI